MMKNTTICSPFEKPKRHFKLDTKTQQVTDTILPERRESFYLVKSRNKKTERQQEQLFDNEVLEHDTVNLARKVVGEWRRTNGSLYTLTKTTQKLLEHWRNTDHYPRLFFCQIEAIETAIYLNEVASQTRSGIHKSLMTRLEKANKNYNSSILRMAFKMATGTGKTLVMGMLIAYHFLNRQQAPRDKRFADNFLVITPNITIKDRLEVLKPNVEGNYYKKHKLVPTGMMETMTRAPIVVTNFHAFKLKDKGQGVKILRQAANQPKDAFKENDKHMVDRVCKPLGKDILILNDEAHHCYPHINSISDTKELKDKEEKDEAEERKKTAQLWMNGLKSVKKHRSPKLVYDLSATPFFLKGSGEPEGKIFPWVVSDFSLTEAIESGIVKIPIVPARNDPSSDAPNYRYLWDDAIRKKLNTKTAVPNQIELALRNLYSSYNKLFDIWFKDKKKAKARGNTPPAFIVVCQNTKHSRKIRDLVTGKLALFGNDNNLYTILVDSREMDSGESISNAFKEDIKEQVAAIKGKRADKVDAEDILRTMMNTVGKRDEPGAEVRCVVSVSMLSEGWDADNVTHILGVRAFSTQLLCEQVVGRALRRTSYASGRRVVDLGNGDSEEIESFTDEYAEIYGVPFDVYFPVAYKKVDPPTPVETTHVHSMAERIGYEIRFPLVEGYVRTFAPACLVARFTEDSRLDLPERVASPTARVAALVGPSETRDVEPEQLKGIREATVAYILAHGLLKKYFTTTAEDSLYKDGVEAWRFPSLLQIVRI